LDFTLRGANPLYSSTMLTATHVTSVLLFASLFTYDDQNQFVVGDLASDHGVADIRACASTIELIRYGKMDSTDQRHWYLPTDQNLVLALHAARLVNGGGNPGGGFDNTIYH